MRFTLWDKFLTVVGFTIFLVVGPLVMAFLAHLEATTWLGFDSIWFYVAAAVSLLGLGLALWANYTLIVKGEGGAGNFGSIKLMTETRHLVCTGPYRLCRNPMHLGVFLYYVGLAIIMGAGLALVVPLGLLCFAYFNALVLDEPRLKRDFPEEWRAYKAKVPRFVPRLF